MSRSWWFSDTKLCFSVPELLKEHGIPDTPENRENLTRELVDLFRKRYPGAEVNVVERTIEFDLAWQLHDALMKAWGIRGS